jgi:hypothetical protein
MVCTTHTMVQLANLKGKDHWGDLDTDRQIC